VSRGKARIHTRAWPAPSQGVLTRLIPGLRLYALALTFVLVQLSQGEHYLPPEEGDGSFKPQTNVSCYFSYVIDL